MAFRLDVQDAGKSIAECSGFIGLCAEFTKMTIMRILICNELKGHWRLFVLVSFFLVMCDR